MVSEHDLLENVFNRFLKGTRVFKDRDVLRTDYIPSHLPHREEQLQRIGGILAPVLRGYRGSNVFIYGKTGTGKTAVVKFVLDYLTRKGREVGAPVEVCYVNCRIAGTDYRILARLGETVSVEVPFTGLATGEVFDRFKVGVEAKRCLLIVVLDEIDALVKTRGDALLYELTRVNEGLKYGHASLVGISNDLHFKELLEPRVLSSLSEEEVVFRPYSAPELLDILQERAQLAFVEGALEESAMNLCAALAAAEHGDARRALDLLRVAGELAEREEADHVSESHIRRAEEKIEEDRVVVVLRTLPLHSKVVMMGVYLMGGKKIDRSVTGDVYDIYRELCGQIGVEALTQRRVSGLINELDGVGLLNARVVNLGRYGRTKRVRLGVSRDVVRDVYREDSWVGGLIDYTPRCLTDGRSR